MSFILFDSRETEEVANSLWYEMDKDKRPANPWCPEVWNEANEIVSEEYRCLLDTLVRGIPDEELLLVGKEIWGPGDRISFWDYDIVDKENAFDAPYDLQIYYEDGNIWLRKFHEGGMCIMADKKILRLRNLYALEEGTHEYDDLLNFIIAVEEKKVPSKSWLECELPKYTFSLAPVFKDFLDKNVVEKELQGV